MAHEEHVIAHLSKEIETHTNNLMNLRTKINLSVFLGPFVILGYLLIATKGFSVQWKADALVVAAVAVMCICFMAMGFISGIIEKTIQRQCNKWREVIARLQRDHLVALESKDLVFQVRIMPAYIFIFSLQLISITCTVYLILHLGLIGQAGFDPGKTP